MTNEEFIKSIRLDGEKWREIAGYKGLYMISSMGRVLSLGREIFNGKSYYYRNPKLITPNKFYVGVCHYNSVMLFKNGDSKRFTVHRLVALSFIKNKEGYPLVDHINRDGFDNRVENLRWCTQKMNMANSNTRKVLSVCHDGHDGSYRWRPVIQLKGDDIVKKYDSIIDTKRYGFNPNIVSQVCAGSKKSHLGYKWMYLSDYEKLNNE